MQPLVSIIIPVYNGEKFLANAIKMVCQQNYHPLEIIVVDDGSTDTTAAVAAQFGFNIQYVYQSNQGPAAARNCGIQMASGDVVAFLDVDDTWVENAFTKMLNYLITHPRVEIVQGLIRQIHAPNLDRDKIIEHPWRSSGKPYYFFNLTSAFYRRSVFDKVGLFDETLRYGEDFDWFLRAWEHRIQKETINVIYLKYYKHPDSMTRNKDLVELGLVQVFKRRRDRLSETGSHLHHYPESFPMMCEYIYPWQTHVYLRILIVKGFQRLIQEIAKFLKRVLGKFSRSSSRAKRWVVNLGKF